GSRLHWRHNFREPHGEGAASLEQGRAGCRHVRRRDSQSSGCRRGDRKLRDDVQKPAEMKSVGWSLIHASLWPLQPPALMPCSPGEASFTVKKTTSPSLVAVA